METVKITIEQKEKKVMISLYISEGEVGDAKLTYKWEPPMEKDNMQAMDYIAFKILHAMSEGKF